MLRLSGQIQDAVTTIRQHWSRTPRVGIILGTGLGGLTSEIDQEAVISYQIIPHFPRSTAIGHKGQLVCGNLAGVPVVTMEGRFHAYEGYPLQQITLPVRVMNEMGIELLIVSNASGGMNDAYRPGDVMILKDHINLMGDNPLTGINDDNLGPRFPDMSEPYDKKLIDIGMQVAEDQEIRAHRGVYVALKGPNYETPAEYRFLKVIGGDVVGMSTVPEVIVAAHVGLKVFAISTITNVALPEELEPVDGEAIVEAAERAEASVRKIVIGIVKHVRQS